MSLVEWVLVEELLGAMRGSLEAHVCCGMWGEHGTRQCGTSSQIPNLQQSSLNYLLLALSVGVGDLGRY